MIIEQMKSFEALREVLKEARKDYTALGTQSLIGLDEDQRRLYFARYSLLKELLTSMEALFDANRRLTQLETVYFKHLERQKAKPIPVIS
jgi:hypothetical protein